MTNSGWFLFASLRQLLVDVSKLEVSVVAQRCKISLKLDSELKLLERVPNKERFAEILQFKCDIQNMW